MCVSAVTRRPPPFRSQRTDPLRLAGRGGGGVPAGAAAEDRGQPPRLDQAHSHSVRGCSPGARPRVHGLQLQSLWRIPTVAVALAFAFGSRMLRASRCITAHTHHQPPNQRHDQPCPLYLLCHSYMTSLWLRAGDAPHLPRTISQEEGTEQQQGETGREQGRAAAEKRGAQREELAAQRARHAEQRRCTISHRVSPPRPPLQPPVELNCFTAPRPCPQLPPTKCPLQHRSQLPRPPAYRRRRRRRRGEGPGSAAADLDRVLVRQARDQPDRYGTAVYTCCLQHPPRFSPRGSTGRARKMFVASSVSRSVSY